MKLFALYLGGRALGCSVEVHDVVFCIAKTLEETYPTVIKKWFGDPCQVHIDSYIELTHVDGYRIELSEEIVDQENKLFFVQFGGYLHGLFGEIHKSIFLVAKDQGEAIRRGKEILNLGLYQEHLDECLDIENLTTISKIEGYYLIFIPDLERPSSAACPGYQSLRVPCTIG